MNRIPAVSNKILVDFPEGRRIPSRKGNRGLNVTEQIRRLKCPFTVHDNRYSAK